MFNELLFTLQALFIIGFSLGALKLGKSALVAWVAIQALIANIFVLKQITLFGFEVTASDAFAIGSLMSLNFLQEYFTKEEANKATWICFFTMIFFVFVSQIHLLYIPGPHDFTQEAFNRILTPSPRLLVASMLVFLVVQQFDIRFFAFLKKKFPLVNFAYRSALSLIVSQFLDTVLFSYAGLYGIVASVVSVIFISFLVKLIVIFFFTPLVRWIKA